jgi:hypothetical protein
MNIRCPRKYTRKFLQVGLHRYKKLLVGVRCLLFLTSHYNIRNLIIISLLVIGHPFKIFKKNEDVRFNLKIIHVLVYSP